MSSISCNISVAWGNLKAIEFHVLDDLTETYDRRGRLASLIFKKFSNEEYQRESIIFAVRALTALLAGHYSLMDLEEYSYDEMNDCWIYYDNLLEQHRQMCIDDDLVVVAVLHKYWTQAQIHVFKEFLEGIAFLYDATVTHDSN